MKSARVTVFLALFLLGLHPCRGSGQLVRHVYDGDTILLADGRKVRYLGIDTPEIDHEGGQDEPLAQAAWRYNRRLLKEARVRLEFDRERKDRYGRVLAYLFLPDGRMVNALLLQEGLAHILFHGGPPLRHRALLLHCQAQAMASGKGLWGLKIRRNAPFFLGNRRSLRFHRPECPLGRKTRTRNRIRFATWKAAFAAGYSPCRRCRPWAPAGNETRGLAGRIKR